ncbi:hypothetical protein PVAP13_9KG378804 [Panicum virgatum]|uniref:Uncharacterized protein n=1 Tax=Panicum virgatum TaxID=38727 RepID=A0A8T0NP18_PANVG|nr:hypothetical protein PVAP13_9KG378804 [Panicum virgatum]
MRLPLPVGARRRSPWSEMKKMRPFTRWQWVRVAGDARTPSLSEDGTKQGKALYIGVANLQAVGAWVIFCPAAVQLLLRRRGRLLAPPLTGRRFDVDRAKGRRAVSLPAQSVHVRVP